ncbi:MAG: DUF4434 domain-containing protein [candidate division FCPU426 bacterium]
MIISATFLDEITHDIPSQNWGRTEWSREFKLMRAAGIDTVVQIRVGHRRWMSFDSKVLKKEQNCHQPPVDLVAMFLELAGENNMAYYFGTYDSGQHWHEGRADREIAINKPLVEEVWEHYGKYPAFKGWYLSHEVSRNVNGIVDILATMGGHCKKISNNLPVLISPYIAGKKEVSAFESQISREEGVSLNEHEAEWDKILSGIKGQVDQIAFQDGHVDFHELPAFLELNRRLAERHGLQSWSNTETFDRDMPIKFLPIAWPKLLLKLQAARAAGIEKVITFEFPHFLSPHSCYPQAHGLFERYCEHFGIRAQV